MPALKNVTRHRGRVDMLFPRVVLADELLDGDEVALARSDREHGCLFRLGVAERELQAGKMREEVVKNAFDDSRQAMRSLNGSSRVSM